MYQQLEFLDVSLELNFLEFLNIMLEVFYAQEAVGIVNSKYTDLGIANTYHFY